MFLSPNQSNFPSYGALTFQSLNSLKSLKSRRIFKGFCVLNDLNGFNDFNAVVLNDETYIQPLCCCFIVDANGIGHTDGQRGGASQGCHNLPQFGVEREKYIHHPLCHQFWIQTAVEAWVLGGDALGAKANVTHIATVCF
jgi:hypothetical protein